MDTWGYITVIAAALVIGLIAEYVVRQQFGYEWILTAIGAGIGGFVASEYLGALSDWGTHWEGLRIWPALIGALVVGVVVEVVLHYMTNLPTSTHGTSHPPLAR
jgi:uncharacterized membrane protein YeaQ/YmgE (transglycosylase-associated protein family)